MTCTYKTLLKFLITLKKILKVQNLKTITLKYVVTKNLLVVEVLRMSEQKYCESGNRTTTYYELDIKGMTTYFFPPKTL